MKLAVTQLAEGDSQFTFNSQKDAWVREVMKSVAADGYTLKSDLNVDVQVTKLEPDYYVRGNLAFQVEQTCARCAEAFPLPLTHPFAVAMAHQNHRTPKTALAEESDELDIHFFEGKEIDLEPIVREQFVLSIPYQSLCAPDCKGVCQKCGTNLNMKVCGCPKGDGFSPFTVLEQLQH